MTTINGLLSKGVAGCGRSTEVAVDEALRRSLNLGLDAAVVMKVFWVAYI
jgi:hypothetical protein